MKKRILSLVLALSMMISLFPVSALAQTPGGGGAALAEENGTTATPIEITIGSDGKPTTEGDGTNWEYAGTDLYLHQGIYTFSAPVTCGVIIYNGATVAGGTFEGTVWNEPGGKISGGTFKKAVSNKGVIEGGTFTGEKNDDSKDTTCAINYDTGKITSGAFYGTVQNDGVITGGVFLQSVYYGTNQTGKVYSGVFKSVPYGEVDATIQRVLDARKPGILKVKTDEKMDFAELNYTNSGFFVIMPTIGERPVLWVQFCNENGEVVDITNLNGKPIGIDTYNSSWNDATKILTFTMPSDAHVMLNGYIKTLEIDRNGKPVTEDRWCYNGVYSGDGWAYYPSKGENGLLSLSNTSGNWNFTDKAIQCDVKVNNGATVTGGTFYKNVENNGTVKNSAFYGTVTNKDSGKMENVAFVGCEKLTNSGNITGAVVRADGGNITFSNTGTIDNAVFDFNEGIERARELKEANGKAITVGVVGCKYYVFISDNVKKLYVVGTPKLDVRINDNTLIANINGDVNYGNLTPEKTAGYQQFTVQSGNGDIVLNQIGAPDPSEVKHTLTLVNAELVGMTGTEFTENTMIKIKPKFDGEEFELDCWSSEPTDFDVSSIYANGDGTYTLKMPGKALTLTANGQKKTYSLTVANGVIGDEHGTETGGKYAKDAEITLTQKVPEDKVFTGWELSDGLTLVEDAGCTLESITIKVTMPGHAATATATYKDKAPTTYTLIVENGYIGDDETKISGDYEAGATIKLTAKDAVEGKEFDKWELDGLTLVDDYQETNATIKVTITGNATAKATYKNKTVTPTPGGDDDQPKTYTVTVKGGKINNKTEEKAKKGIELTVDVDEKEVPEGMTFDVWSIRFPEDVKDTLTPSVNLHDPHMSFAMPGADITIEAQYRSSELPGEDDGPSTLGTMATVAVGGAAAGILVWQGVSLGVDSYLQLNLPQGAAVPANRRELVKLLWETAGKPETALPSLYSDVPAEEIELQKATRWAIDNGLVKSADDNDASRFDPDRYVTKYDVFGAWLKLKKLMK